MTPAPVFEPVIGLEVHIQLHTLSKAFSGSRVPVFGRLRTRDGSPDEADPGFASYGQPNTHIDAYTIGLPGTLPVPNHRAIEYALRLGLACGCRIAQTCEFSRKHYFYPDLPKGYQLTQHDQPLCTGGGLDFLHAGKKLRIGLVRMHIEEDAAKLTHLLAEKRTLIDFNRAGVPLVEVVTLPQIRSAGEAAEFLRALHGLARCLGITTGRLEDGSLRCDVNVSVRREGETALSQRVEVKNINSFRNVVRAIDFELSRQTALRQADQTVQPETRRFNAETGTTEPMRAKEHAADYHHLVDQDLPPLVIDPVWLESIRAALPETPMQRFDRYRLQLGLSLSEAHILSRDVELCAYFEGALRGCGLTETSTELSAATRRRVGCCVRFIVHEWLGRLRRHDLSIVSSPVKPEDLGELIRFLDSGNISSKQAKDVFGQMWETQKTAAEIIQSQGVAQTADDEEIRSACHAALSDPSLQAVLHKVPENPRVISFFVGRVLREMKHRGNPERIAAVLLQLLKTEKS